MLVASLGALAGLVQEKGGATPSPGTPAQQSPIAEKPDSAGNTPEMTSQDEAAKMVLRAGPDLEQFREGRELWPGQSFDHLCHEERGVRFQLGARKPAG